MVVRLRIEDSHSIVKLQQNMIRLSWVVVAIVGVIQQVAGTPFGSPVSACPTMEPNHGAFPEDGPCPYFTTLSRTEMLSDQTLTITLQNKTAQSFQGI